MSHPAALVVVEWMPLCLRESHRAAGNAGVYPNNGADRVLMSRADAEALRADDPAWTEIVRPASANDRHTLALVVLR